MIPELLFAILYAGEMVMSYSAEILRVSVTLCD